MEEDCSQGSLKKECKTAKGTEFYSYYDGNIDGPVLQTSISFAGVTSKEHYLMVAKDRTTMMDSRIVGLTKSHSKYPNFMETLKSNNLIDEIAFSLLYNPINVSKVITGRKRHPLS